MFQYILHKCLFQSDLKSKKCINDIYTVIFDFKKRIYKVFFFYSIDIYNQFYYQTVIVHNTNILSHNICKTITLYRAFSVNSNFLYKK